jgi:hypothetical protein
MHSDQSYLLNTAGGKITCPRCQAMSKRTRLQCSAPAEKGKRVCRFHGGRSTGALTPEGKARSANANFKSGEYSRASLDKAAKEKALIRVLEDAAHILGITEAPRTPGRKPDRYWSVETLEDVLPAIMALHHM